MMTTKNELAGLPLRPAVSIYVELGDVIAERIARMAKETRRELEAAFLRSDHLMAMDDSISSQARIVINQLRDRWTVRFNRLAKRMVKRMMDQTLKNSAIQLGTSLREVSEGFRVDTGLTDPRLQEIVKASTEQAVGLIKRIPERYLGDVQGEVMRSITSGRGMQDLVPYLTEKYQGQVKWARHVAMDQTRKSFAAINQVRLQKAGCESYRWLHTGGGQHPRKEHIEMSGKEFRWDDPPIIDRKTGERGHPGAAIFCRCIAVPIFKLS
ncbi:MAG: minor capsid protein [Rhodospirillales bacterium]|nr:minor capsid protein [Rhodospirillales bacterium]